MSKAYNGGITITLGDYELETINGYDAEWEDIEAENFENWDFSNVTEYKGRRFSCTVSAAKLSAEDKAALLTALSPRIIRMKCPDYEGMVKISNVSAELTNAKIFGERYTVNFSAAAVALVPVSGGL